MLNLENIFKLVVDSLNVIALFRKRILSFLCLYFYTLASINTFPEVPTRISDSHVLSFCPVAQS